MNLLEFNPEKSTCHSGGAPGSDTCWETYAMLYGIKVNAYSFKTKEHKSSNKIEISKEDYEEGVDKIKKANKILGRKNIDKYMNLLARNWAQVKYSREIFAIGNIIDFNKGIVSGGTGYAIAMSIFEYKTIYIFNQDDNNWYKWSYIIDQFMKIKTPIIQTKNFAGIGTRKINKHGENAIKDVFAKTFGNLSMGKQDN